MNWNGETAKVGFLRLWVFVAEAGTGFEKWFSRVSCDGDRDKTSVRLYANQVGFSTKKEAQLDAEKGYEGLMAELDRARSDSPTNN